MVIFAQNNDYSIILLITKKFFFRIGPLIYLQELTALPIVNKAQWLWRRRFLDFIIVLSLFWYYLDSKCVSSYEQIGIPFTKGCFLLILVKLAHYKLYKEYFQILKSAYLIIQVGVKDMYECSALTVSLQRTN